MSSLGGVTHTILTVEKNLALVILSPILQWGTIPYSGMYLNHAPDTSIFVPPLVSPLFGSTFLTTGL